MKSYDKIIEELNILLVKSQERELGIKLLRNNGYSKLESIEIIRKFLNISYDDSHSIVHNSTTWNDVKEYDDRLMNDFFDILEESDGQITQEKNNP